MGFLKRLQWILLTTLVAVAITTISVAIPANWIRSVQITGKIVPTPSAVNVTFDIYPNALNLRSVGKWITGYVECPNDYDVTAIDRNTLMLDNSIPVDPLWVDTPIESVIGDYDNDGRLDLTIKFNRTLVVEHILSQTIECGNFTLILRGRFYDDMLLEGSETLQISRLLGDSNCDGKIDILDLTLASSTYASKESEQSWNPNVNFAKPWDLIDICDLVTISARYGQKCP